MAAFEQRRRKNGVCKNGPADISVLLKMVLDKSNITEDMTFKTLSEGFEKVVGTLLLPHVKIDRFNKGILVLKCANSAWKHELFLQKKAIIDKCNTLLGKPFVRSIRFV